MIEKIYKGFLHIAIIVNLYMMWRTLALGEENFFLFLASTTYFIYRLGVMEHYQRKAKELGISVDEYLKQQQKKQKDRWKF